LMCLMILFVQVLLFGLDCISATTVETQQGSPLLSIVVTTNQNAQFSICVFKNCSGVIPWNLTAGGGDPLLHPTPSPAFGRTRKGWVRGASAPVLGPKPWSPQIFSRVCAPTCLLTSLKH